MTDQFYEKAIDISRRYWLGDSGRELVVAALRDQDRESRAALMAELADPEPPGAYQFAAQIIVAAGSGCSELAVDRIADKASMRDRYNFARGLTQGRAEVATAARETEKRVLLEMREEQIRDGGSTWVQMLERRLAELEKGKS